MKKKKWQLKMTRRQILKAGMIGGAGLMLPLRFLPAKAFAAPIVPGLSDPALQPKFVNIVPDALMPAFKYTPFQNRGRVNFYRVGAGYKLDHWTGLVLGDARKFTPVYGYGQLPTDDLGYTWPGRTFEVQAGQPTVVGWYNNIPIEDHLLPVDTTLHWCYSLHGYMNYSIAENGVPIVMHLHGGHTLDRYDGNPEQFFSPDFGVKGPRFADINFMYFNDRPAGNLWYHDHALGITRLNVYAGLAGFYFVRDENDTGLPGNPLNLPAWPYEKAYAIQDRMFRENGELFYPAFPGDPAYADFIETALPEGFFPDNPNEIVGFDGGGPTALAEFFGDHMVVNGLIWPKENVEPRPYRMHLLNGTDSRFMGIRFRVAGEASAEPTEIPGDSASVPFKVIGSDQGLASNITEITSDGYLVFEPGSRYDIIINFAEYEGRRIIMENIGADEPFGGDFPEPGAERIFEFTDRIMAFDVVLELGSLHDADPVSPTDSEINFGPDVPTTPTRTRKVALFEGRDEFERLQPLLGTAEPATDFRGRPINWPNTQPYIIAGLVGQMEGSMPWHSPTTENPAVNTTEEWEIWNLTGDAHPIHLHLVHFEIIGRREIKFDSNVDEDGFIPVEEDPADDGIYLVQQPVVQHNGDVGSGFRIVHPPDPDDAYGPVVPQPEGYVENTPKDMVTALPGQITRIKARFDKPGRYVWHCHILSHEDHEMMRVLHIGGGHKDPSQ